MANFNIQLAEQAEKEIEEICEWYEQKKNGLSSYFIHHFEEGLNRIANNPRSFAFVFKNKQLRKFYIKKFPYKIYFLINKNIIEILAIIHSGRSKRFIKKRLP
ncbi:MAG TPA: type II toxin-antitoxin system RelE/ParE family toxin [Puia sp.]|jgi:plasmid stabilization system protein ParE|nr:type II toxin-antitoxin system RelE/ParE family toxin [Puia sp.]